MFFSRPFPVRPRKAFVFLLFQVKLKDCFIEGKKNDFQQNTSQIVSVSKMAVEKKVLLFFRSYSNISSNVAFLMEKSSAEMLLFFCEDLCARCLKPLPFQFQNEAKGWAPYPLSLKYMYCFSSLRKEFEPGNDDYTALFCFCSGTFKTKNAPS